MKKFFHVGIIVLLVFMVIGCKENKIISDSEKFINEYELLNDKENSNGNKYRVVNIPDNKIMYKTDIEVVDIIKNETAVIYFGFNTCPWCRAMIEDLIRVTNDLNIEKVYYLDIKDIRNTMEVTDDGNIINSKSGSPGYMELLDILGEHLDYYTVQDKNGNKIQTMAKRIYAPTVLVVKDGEIIGLTDGISDKLANPYGIISDDIHGENYSILHELIVKIKSNICLEDGNC